MAEVKYHKGFTVGTFDLFHIGHLNLLRQAKEYCEYLIVGVHSDEWVLHCKGRPAIIPYQERADIVAAIRYEQTQVRCSLYRRRLEGNKCVEPN